MLFASGAGIAEIVMNYPSQFGLTLLLVGIALVAFGVRLGQSKNLGMIPMVTWGFVTAFAGVLLFLGDAIASTGGQTLAQVNGAAGFIGTLVAGMLVGLHLPKADVVAPPRTITRVNKPSSDIARRQILTQIERARQKRAPQPPRMPKSEIPSYALRS
jgi:ABC-type xylose transport system permease subunit